MTLTIEQLKLIKRMNGISPKKDCPDCLGETCWLATEAAGNALEENFEMPRGYENCENAAVVLMSLVELTNMSQG